MHYTQLGKPEYAKPIASYLTGIDHGLATSDALAGALPEGIEPLETELQAYARQSRFRAALIDIPSDHRVSDEALRLVPSLEGDKRVITMLLESVRHPSPSFLHGVIDLSKRSRDDPTVTILLASVYQYDNRFNLADPLLQRTCVLPFSSALNAYLCANAYKNRMQEFKPKTPERTAAVAQARLCYQDALRIQPLYLQALAGLADTCIDETGDSSGVRSGEWTEQPPHQLRAARKRRVLGEHDFSAGLRRFGPRGGAERRWCVSAAHSSSNQPASMRSNMTQ